MSWAAGRRMRIIGILGVVLLLGAGLIAFFTLHTPPSCTDGLHNGNETGVDCGGSCAYVCTAEYAPPVVSFVRSIRLPNGRTDVIAYVENPNAGIAARNVSFTVELYGTDRSIVAERTGTLDLPPRGGGVVPVYLPNIFSGSREVAQTFLSFDTDSLYWFRYDDRRLLPKIEDPVLERIETTPRVRVQVENPHPSALRNVKLVATVFDESGTAIGASQTVLAELAAGASTEAVFTWNTPFRGTPSVVDVKSVVGLSP